MIHAWDKASPPRPDQIDLAQPVDWSHPQSRGLVAYYPFWLASSVVAAASDLALRRHPITDSGDYPSVVGDGTFGRSALYNGSSDRLSKITTPFFNRGCTISAWFNSTSSTTRQVLFGKSSHATSTAIMSLDLMGDTAGDPVRMGVYDGSNASAAQSTQAYPSGQWALATGAVNANGSTIAWLNGSAKGADVSITNEPAATVMSIGMLYWGGSFSRYFAGRLGEIRVYNRVLSDLEVHNLWHPSRRWGMLRTLSTRRVFIVPAGPSTCPFFFNRYILRRRFA